MYYLWIDLFDNTENFGYNTTMDSEILEIYTNLPQRIRDIKSWTVRKDLLKMYRNCENIKREISREQVNSRNLTVNHQLLYLDNKFSESVTNLDQYVTLALLSI
jgi:hypothetical protein